jgi:Family of unknown function (DUF6535)
MRPQRRKRKANPARGMRIDGGALRNDGFCLNLLDMITTLILTAAQQDSENEMWNMYMNEVKKDDKRMADAWKEDSNGILVFVSLNLLVPLLVSMTRFKTGLFSATVGAFIIEFYKQLSPSSGIQTVIPLANGSYTIIASQPPPPKASIIWVNAMWLISLVLSLTSALIATLLQQWARRYVEMPHRPNDPKDRARVRSFLYFGTKFYKMRFAVQLAPTLLHLSVYLFFAGLVVVFRTINKSVAIAVEVAVGVFGVAYITLSILPCLDVRCPYRTPMSYFLWYPTHAILSFSAICLRWVLELFHGCLVEPTLDDPDTPTKRILVGWLDSREKAVKTHWRYIKDGIGKSIINSATKSQDGDRRIVTRLFDLLAMGDKSKLRQFAASIPRDKVLDLIPCITTKSSLIPCITSKSREIVLQEPLRILLQNCAAGTGVAGSDAEVRRRSLLVCLDAIHNIVKDPSVPDLNYVRTNYANINLMRAWLDSGDTAIRLASRSICALIAKQVVKEEWLEESQLVRWLQEVTGSTAVHRSDPDTRKHINLKSFVSGVLSNQVGDLPTEDTSSFKETLAILLDVENDANLDANFKNRLSEEVERIRQDDPEGSDDLVDRLRTMFGLPIPFPQPSSQTRV